MHIRDRICVANFTPLIPPLNGASPNRYLLTNRPKPQIKTKYYANFEMAVFHFKTVNQGALKLLWWPNQDFLDAFGFYVHKGSHMLRIKDKIGPWKTVINNLIKEI